MLDTICSYQVRSLNPKPEVLDYTLNSKRFRAYGVTGLTAHPSKHLQTLRGHLNAPTAEASSEEAGKGPQLVMSLNPEGSCTQLVYNTSTLELKNMHSLGTWPPKPKAHIEPSNPWSKSRKEALMEPPCRRHHSHMDPSTKPDILSTLNPEL